ncbi:MAG TPA: hypothetical protein VLL28_12735, partial [Hyphomicrobiaceae bacterium]|nr:hypothetical protein [Hyphomicrobiaceae bacterium]
MKSHTTAHRKSGLWIAAMVHRLSGLALACFLPLHFLAPFLVDRADELSCRTGCCLAVDQRC